MSPRKLSLPVIYDRVDQAVARTRNAAVKLGHTVACRAGCAACCYHPVLLSEPEGRAVVQHLWARDGETALEQLRGRAEAQAVRVRSVFSLDGYRRLGEPCLFLKEDATCDVYPVRPLACRLHVSLGDPALCSGPMLRVPQLEVGPIRSWAVEAIAAHVHERIAPWRSLLGSDDAFWRAAPSFARVIIDAIDADVQRKMTTRSG